MNLTRFWDWVDKRQIDKHTVSLIVLYGTKSVTDWAESFVSSHPDQSGALVIAAVCIPYNAIGFQLFDTSYNGGHPIKWPQEAVGTVADGIVGAATIGAVRGTDVWRVLALFNASRAEYFVSLKQPEFADGRLNRIAGNLRKGLES